jgi:hypothetical protein
VPDAQDANSQMRGQVDTADKEDAAKNEIRGDGKNAQRDLNNGNRADGALDQGNEAGKSKRGSADHRNYGSKNSYAHSGTPAARIKRDAAFDAVELRTKF